VTLYSADSAGPVYLTGAVVITQVLSFASQAREVIAIDAATGALRWSRKIGALGMLGGASAPRLCWVADGKVAVSMDAEVGDSVGGKHPFALFDAATGALTWRGDQAPTSDRSRRRATFGDITFSFDYQPAWPHTYLRAVRNDDGAEVWRVAWDGLDDQSPMPMGLLTHEGQVYLLSHRAHWVRIHALHAATGQIMWRWRSPRWLFALFLLRQALQRIREARRNRTWRSFWSDALHLRWRHPLRPEGEPVMDAARGRLYVATSLGVFALRMRDGRRLWHALPFVGVRLVHVPPTGAEG
jgi:outer membrane protein assembly factor BamB